MHKPIDGIIQRLMKLPRLLRIVIAIFFALMVTLAVSPLVDHIYIRYFFTSETTIVPSLVTLVIGGIMYIFGWLVYIGIVGKVEPAQKRILWYFGIGILATIVVVVLLVQGLAILNLPV